MRKLVISTVIGLTALTGQAFAKQTAAAASAVRVGDRVGVQTSDSNQLASMGLGLIPIIVIVAGVIAVVSNSDDNKYTVCISAGC